MSPRTLVISRRPPPPAEFLTRRLPPAGPRSTPSPPRLAGRSRRTCSVARPIGQAGCRRRRRRRRRCRREAAAAAALEVKREAELEAEETRSRSNEKREEAVGGGTSGRSGRAGRPPPRSEGPHRQPGPSRVGRATGRRGRSMCGLFAKSSSQLAVQEVRTRRGGFFLRTRTKSPRTTPNTRI